MAIIEQKVHVTFLLFYFSVHHGPLRTALTDSCAFENHIHIDNFDLYYGEHSIHFLIFLLYKSIFFNAESRNIWPWALRIITGFWSHKMCLQKLCVYSLDAFIILYLNLKLCLRSKMTKCRFGNNSVNLITIARETR